jgi:hypothetical protein
MVLELHPALQGLSAEDKLRLSEELCMDVMLDAAREPALASVVKQRLNEYRASPQSGIPWEELKNRLITRQPVQ